MLGLPALSPAAFKYFDPTKPADIPQKLSQTGFYTNIGAKTTDTAAKPFVVNSALWSDGSLKKRWVILRPGKKINWVDDTDFFDYPDSTVFVKNFLHVRKPGDTIYWETRFLVKKADPAPGGQSWYGFSYRWDTTTQTEANLVDPDAGGKGVLPIKDEKGRTTYKKWVFPSQNECNQCHLVRSEGEPPANMQPRPGRGVLGFYPAQLKRPSQNGASNQVLDLFAAGVFSGTQPNAASLAKRFVGMGEAIDPGLTAEQRKGVVDRMARSYLAANCSGCHGDRAATLSMGGAVIPPNFDYFDLRQHNKPFTEVGGDREELRNIDPYLDSSMEIKGRNKYKWLVSSWGMGTDPNWSLALPPGDPAALRSKEMYVDPATSTGYTSLSYGLFRQWARKTPATDSAAWSRALKQDSMLGDANAKAKLAWMFAKPWGSQEWINNLAAHGFTLDSVMAGWQGVNMYNNDGDAMPLLASYIPDTAALKILGEWVTKGGALVSNPGNRIRANVPRAILSPYIRDRVLIVPAGLAGEVRMMDLRGRAFGLTPKGDGRYAIPESAKNGLYFFRVGQRLFKTSFLN